MVSLKVVDGKFIGIDDEFVPVPHSLTRIITKSGNYGLADAARAHYGHLALKEGEIPGPVRRLGRGSGANRMEDDVSPSTSAGGGRGRGRGRGLGIKPAAGASGGESVASSRGRGCRPVFRDNRVPFLYRRIHEVYTSGVGEDVKEPAKKEEKKKEEVTYHAVEGPQPGEDDIRAPVANLMKQAKNAGGPVGVGGGGGGKTNGYCLFMKFMGRKTGNTGSISELMSMFDQDWRMLPDEEKQEWKLRAKTGGRFPTTGGGGGAAGRGARGGGDASRERKASSSAATTGSTTPQHLTTEESDDGY